MVGAATRELYAALLAVAEELVIEKFAAAAGVDTAELERQLLTNSVHGRQHSLLPLARHPHTFFPAARDVGGR